YAAAHHRRREIRPAGNHLRRPGRRARLARDQGHLHSRACARQWLGSVPQRAHHGGGAGRCTSGRAPEPVHAGIRRFATVVRHGRDTEAAIPLSAAPGPAAHEDGESRRRERTRRLRQRRVGPHLCRRDNAQPPRGRARPGGGGAGVAHRVVVRAVAGRLARAGSLYSSSGPKLRGAAMAYDRNNIFARILRGEIPSHTVHEDELTLAFMDVMPRTDGHTLVIPKAEAETILDVPEEVLAAVVLTTQRVARAVKKAFDAPGILIAQLNGRAA